jgi:hypothetical protein
MAQVTFQEAGTGAAASALGAIAPSYPTTSIAANDLLIMLVWCKSTSVTPTNPAGWSSITSGSIDSASNFLLTGKIATGSETGTQSVSFTSDAAVVKMARIYRWRNQVTTNVPSAVASPVGGNATGSDTTAEIPSVSSSTNSSSLVAFIWTHDDNTQVVSSAGSGAGSYVEPVAEFLTTAGDDGGIGIWQADTATAGTVSGGVITVTGGGGAADIWDCYVLEIKSASPAANADGLDPMGAMGIFGI